MASVAPRVYCSGRSPASYFDFHGQTPAEPDVTVMDYAKGMGAASHGALVAPFAGIHGWYFQTQSELPVTVKLRLDGFYEMRSDPTAGEGT